MKKMKVFKFCILGLTSLLVLDSLANINSLNVLVFAEDNGTYTYVEDIVGFAPYTDGFSWSKVEEYRNLGYKQVDGNFNEETGFNKSETYLMYKTTNDESKALRKVSTMEMDGGYYDWDYSSIVETNDNNINHSIQEFREACNYYQIHNRLEEYYSIEAKKQLDFYFYPKKTTDQIGEKLGTFLLNDRNDDEYKRILLYSNSTIMGNITNAIMLSGTEIGPTLWMDRFVEELKNPICSNLDNIDDTDYPELKNKYGDTLKVISSNINLYVKDLEKAKVNLASKNLDTNDEFVSIDKEIDDMVEDSVDENSESNEDMTLLMSDAILSTYKVNNIAGKSTNLTLSDIFNEMGKSDVESTYGYMYALIKALNPAQIFGLKFSGFCSTMLFTSLSLDVNVANLTAEEKEIYEKYGKTSSIDTQIEKSREKFISLLGTDCISIYEGTDSDLLDRYCAMTEEATRSNSALNEIDRLSITDGVREDLLKALTYVGYAAQIVGTIGMISFSLGCIFFPTLGPISMIKLGINAIRHAAVRTVKAVIGASIGSCSVIGLAICVCVAVIIGIILLAKLIINKKNEIEEQYSPIPETLMDRSTPNGEPVYSRFDVVRNIMDGTPFNMNYKRVVDMKEQGKRGTIVGGKLVYASKWQALYYTKDSRIGAPLIEKDGVFMAHSHSKNAKITTDMYPVCKFGNYSQADLNGYKNFQCDTSYAAYNKKGEVIDPINKNGKYLESVILRCDKNSTVAKYQIANEGFILFDKNLSPTNDYATYLGYKTTDNSNQAVTDIRLVWNETAGTFYWGDIGNTYGYAGSGLQDVGENGGNKNHVSLYYTKNHSLGSPILSHVNSDESENPDGFGVVPNVKDIPEGYEGINFFSGGTAFNFNFYNKMKTNTFGATKVFVYFKPEIQYTSKNSIAYVSGLAAFSGHDLDGYSFNDFTKTESGFMADTIASTGESFKPIAENLNLCATQLYASYTYNPYRAIYDIGIQFGQENCPYLPTNIIAYNQGYAAINIYCQGREHFCGGSGSTSSDVKARVIRDSHTITFNHDENIDEGMLSVGKGYKVATRNIYVTGPSANADKDIDTLDTTKIKALKANSIHCYNENNIPKSRPGWCSAHQLKNHYFTENYNGVTQEKAQDIVLYGQGRNKEKQTFFLFYESDVRIRPKYVENVFTYESTSEKYAYNETILNLLSAGCDEIFENYTISKLNKKGKDFSDQIFFHINNKTIWNATVNPYENYHNPYKPSSYKDEWSGSGLENYSDAVGFFGVKYTDKSADAICSIKTYVMSKDELASNTSPNPDNIINMKNDITGKMISYNRATDKITCADDMYMWLYTSTSGSKITSVNLSNNLKAGIREDQINSHEFKLNNIVTDQDFSNNRANNFCLTYCTEECSYIKDIVYYYVKKDISFEVALLGARQAGCTDFKIFDVNENIYLVIGYVRTNSRIEAIKDVRITLDNSYDTHIGNYEYTLATRIKSAFTYNGDMPLLISFTRGKEEDKKYALKDLVFYSSTEDLTTTSSNTATFEESQPENVSDFGTSTNGEIFEITFTDGTYSVAMVRKNNKDHWGFQGPNGATASILINNPTAVSLIILISVLVVSGGIGVLIYYHEKKKQTANK